MTSFDISMTKNGFVMGRKNYDGKLGDTDDLADGKIGGLYRQ